MPAKDKKAAGTQEKKITFKCQSCQKVKPLDEMVVSPRFFPPVIVCRECEKKL